MNAKILLVEDEVNIASFLQRGLMEFGYEVSVAYDGEEGWNALCSDSFQLIVMDIIMPKLSGLELCRRFRAQYGFTTPVLLLTALGTTQNIVDGLDAGADDYLVKPFSFKELQARLAALLRRCGQTEQSVSDLNIGELSLNLSAHQARRGETVVDLTVKECRLLEFFIRNQGKILSRETLLKNVWDKNFDTNTNVVDVYVNYLRNKIDRNFGHKYIRTVMGVGYVME